MAPTVQSVISGDAVTGTKKLVRGTAHEGAEEHCHAGALAATHQRIFDWLDETLPA